MFLKINTAYQLEWMVFSVILRTRQTITDVVLESHHFLILPVDLMKLFPLIRWQEKFIT